MRWSSLALLAGSASVASAQSMEKDTTSKKASQFNGKPVPALLEITPNNWAIERSKTKYLVVKHYR